MRLTEMLSKCHTSHKVDERLAGSIYLNPEGVKEAYDADEPYCPSPKA